MEQPATTPEAPKVLSGVAAYLALSDASAAAAFYKTAFGAVEVARMPAGPDDPRLLHCHLHINGASVMLSDAFPEQGYPVQTPQAFTLHMLIEGDIDAAFARAAEAGCEVLLPLQLMFWGDRYGQLKDPYGVSWSMGQPAKA